MGCSYSTISLGHGVSVIPSYNGFRGSVELNLKFAKVLAANNEAAMSSSCFSGKNCFAYVDLGIVEGFWDSRYIPRPGIEAFSQRPALTY